MIENNITINKKQNTQPIGVFDSGVGGLSIAQCIAQQLPNEHLIYVADTLHAPYGDKSNLFIQERVNIVADKLIHQNCKAIVIACNTATVITIDQLRARISIPVIGVEPAIKPAALLSKAKKVGILTTQATARNYRFLSLVEQFKQDTKVFIQPCPGLVELIEQGQLNSIECDKLLATYLAILIKEDVDILVLGCTHYAFLINKIKFIVGAHVQVMETALPVTEQLYRQLQKHNLSASLNQNSHYQFFSSKKSSKLNTLMSNLWGAPIKSALF